jgi:hypothetical protein
MFTLIAYQPEQVDYTVGDNYPSDLKVFNCLLENALIDQLASILVEDMSDGDHPNNHQIQIIRSSGDVCIDQINHTDFCDDIGKMFYAAAMEKARSEIARQKEEHIRRAAEAKQAADNAAKDERRKQYEKLRAEFDF